MFATRMTATSMCAAERAGPTGDEEHHAIHHAETQLKVNETKSVRWRDHRSGNFSDSALPRSGGQAGHCAKALDRFKRRIREITRRAKGVSIETTMEELAPYMRGWRSYFASAKRLACSSHLTCWSGATSRGSLATVEKHHVVVGQLSWHWGSIQN